MSVIFWGLKKQALLFCVHWKFALTFWVAEKINSGQNQLLEIDSRGLALTFLLIFENF